MPTWDQAQTYLRLYPKVGSRLGRYSITTLIESLKKLGFTVEPLYDPKSGGNPDKRLSALMADASPAAGTLGPTDPLFKPLKDAFDAEMLPLSSEKP
jgi:hypothetical protein